MKTQNQNLPKKAESNSITDPETDPAIALLATDEMTEFTNAQSAASHAVERGDAEVMMPAALIHRIFQITQPLDLEHIRQAYNRVCDELGKPEEKQPDPPPIEYDAEKGPF